MILPSGAFVEVRRVGTHAVDGRTLHLVDFWASEDDWKAGKPCAVREDFATEWSSPHDNPGGRMIAIFDTFWRRRLADGRRGDFVVPGRMPWSNAPEQHGNLVHPSMETLRAVAG